MKALSLVVGTSDIHMVDVPAPVLGAEDQVELRVQSVGICGTDREEAAGGRAMAPAGRSELVIGHEMIGKVTRVGGAVTRVKPGDFAVLTVRRGCGSCLPCRMNRSDMCLTGSYRERGIWGMDGYQAETVVDSEQYVVRVPPALAQVGVLTEPLSVAEKAIDEAVRLQLARLPESASRPLWLNGRRCLVAGLGPIGLLAVLALRLRGADVVGLDVVDGSSARPRWLTEIGGRYVDGRGLRWDGAESSLGSMELIVDATGIASLEFNLVEALGRNGVYVLTGIPGGDRPVEVRGAVLVRRLVLENQVMLGSVNASRDHFQMAVEDLAQAALRWPGLLERLVTSRRPAKEFQAVLTRHDPDEIKAILDWTA